MRKIGQRLAHPPAQVTEACDDLAAHVRQVGQGLAVDVIQQPQVQGLPVDGHGQQVLTGQGLDDSGDAQPVLRLQGVERGMLGVQFDGGVVAQADFQNKAAMVGVDAVVEVLLAAK